ncbi:ABC transporter ATP-binding protein [Oceanobacillus alkalisoli]|uniref:ABC transporter ATP-binding protein n=1 Tax=Oceanobacillus alkalisoli TaxID=2925113 RepID=UPI001EE46DD1|nr:energy-coupling factor transporter ATPase [Oceanobacillus alkalisoli]
MKKEQLNRLLQVEGFSFDYESLDKPLLNQLNFSLMDKETTLLIGSSGSGKSSLSLCLNGLYPEAVEGVSSGNIYYRGTNIQDYQKGELSQLIGIVFQDPESQFCMITVEDELAFTLENRKIAPSEMPERISEALSVVGMDGFQKRKIHELSGGQKQKIALAAVLLLEPELLILDEPTANLDPVSRIEFIQLIKHIQAKQKLAVFIIEHQLEDWLDVVDRLLVLGKQGKIIADGSVTSIFSDHHSLLKKEGVFLPRQYSNAEDSYPTYAESPPRIKQDVLITIKQMGFHRKKHTILQDINLEIHRGEFIAIVGENGAGKSTLLQLMARLLTPQKGTIIFHDKLMDQWEEKELRKRIGYVFQNPEHQFITDTVYDELTFGMKLNGWTTAESDTAATALLKQFHLEKHKYSNPFSLSGGQKRRLSVATMLDETPDILFFDEPTFGQDAKTTDELMYMIEALRKNGTAIVFVTHDMDIVDTVDRAIVLYQQHIHYNGEPESLWKQADLLEKTRLRLPYRIRVLHKEGVSLDLVH